MEEEKEIHQEYQLKRIDKPKIEFLKDKYCEVCFKFNDIAKGQSQETEKEEGLEMMFCYECQTCVHKYCYGLNTKTTIEYNAEGEKYIRFLCDKCKYKDNKKEISCIICHGKSGAFKLITNMMSQNADKHQRQTRGQQQEFIHVTCGLFLEPHSILLTSYKDMSFKKCSNLNIQKQLQSEKCFYCEGNIGLFKCTGDSTCQNYCHIHCALVHKVQEALSLGIGVDSQFKMVSSQNLMKYFDSQNQYHQQLISNIEQTIQEYFEVTKHKEWKEKQKQQGKMEIEEENKKKKPKSRAQTIDMRRELSKYLTECKEEIIKQQFQQKTPPPWDYSSLGGQIILECSQHSKEELFCKCLKPYDILQDYLACDYCDNWFHYKCISMTQEEVDRIGVYYCKECKAWEKFRREWELREELPREVESLERLNIVDFVIGGLFCEGMVERGLGLRKVVGEVKKLTVQVWGIIGEAWKEEAKQIAVDRLAWLFQQRVMEERDEGIAKCGLGVFEGKGVKWVQWWIEANGVFKDQVDSGCLERLVYEGRELNSENQEEMLKRLEEQLELYTEVKGLCEEVENGSQITELEFEKLVNSFEILVVGVDKEQLIMTKLVEQLNEWRKIWGQNRLSVSEMQKLLREGERLRVCVGELEDAKKLWMEFKDWEERMRAVVKGERKEVELITCEQFRREIQEGVERFGKIELDYLEEEFERKIANGEAMREKLVRCLGGQMDYNAFKKIKKEALDCEFHFTEIEEINQKLKQHKEMAYFLSNKRASLNVLEENLKSARENNLEEKLIQDIIQKLAHGRNLLAKSQELINKNILDEGDDKEAEAILSDIKS